MKKNPYQQAHEDIAAIIAEVKARKKWQDRDIGKILEVKDATVSAHRRRGTFPNMSFGKIILLADVAGYNIKFERKG